MRPKHPLVRPSQSRPSRTKGTESPSTNASAATRRHDRIFRSSPMSLMWDDNLSPPRETFVTHLECSMSGARHEADRLPGLSDAGWTILVRYAPQGGPRHLHPEETREG